ncbi:MAG: flagellar assembly protein FliH [Treponema sp.]|jgi:flagellar assembly protein FliH|nr:flagellar assembly protein FliH [Treponema sp.]
MPKAVFRPSELISTQEKIIINSPTSFPEMANFAAAEEPEEVPEEADKYTGPTADDLRREAELFKTRWESEKERMIAAAKAEAERIVSDAQNTAIEEIKKQTIEGQAVKQKAEEEAQRIMVEAQSKIYQLEVETRKTLETERADALEQGRQEGKQEGYADGKTEADRLVERAQIVLERAQDKRGDILLETEKEIVDLVLLISRKIIKVITENQRDVIIANVIEALRKVKAKGSVIIRLNLADVELVTEHKQDFINQIESVNTIHVMEDSSVDKGGCIIETDFGEIDARISSQLAELENRILEISPIRSRIKDNTPPPVIRTANLNSELAATSSLMGASKLLGSSGSDTTLNDAMKMMDGSSANDDLQKGSSALVDDLLNDDGPELSQAANAALTASAALAALATMATKGKREADKQITEKMEQFRKRKSDQETP